MSQENQPSEPKQPVHFLIAEEDVQKILNFMRTGKFNLSANEFDEVIKLLFSKFAIIQPKQEGKTEGKAEGKPGKKIVEKKPKK